MPGAQGTGRNAASAGEVLGAEEVKRAEQIRAGMAWCFRRYAKELPPDRRQQHADADARAQNGAARAVG